MRILIPILIGIVALTSCSAGGIAFEFYVVIKPDETEKFIAAVTAIAKAAGLETAVGQAVADTGDAMRVVEGRGDGIKLWVQSMPLSGKEDPSVCGVHSEPYSDPAQFIIFTEPRFFGSKAEAAKLGERVLFQLKDAGFDVRRKPAVCGAAAM